MLISIWNLRWREERHFSKTHHHQQPQQHKKGAGSRETSKFTFRIRTASLIVSFYTKQRAKV
jgi:hypothetical protein